MILLLRRLHIMCEKKVFQRYYKITLQIYINKFNKMARKSVKCVIVGEYLFLKIIFIQVEQ